MYSQTRREGSGGTVLSFGAVIFQVKPASLEGPNLFPGVHTAEAAQVCNPLLNHLCEAMGKQEPLLHTEFLPNPLG